MTTGIDENTPAAPPTGTVQQWAQARRVQARDLRREAQEMRARAADLRRAVRARHATLDDDADLRRRLAAAEARAAHLEIALASNRRVGMAVGILMARHRLTEGQAFDLLRFHSSHRNMKLAALAEDVVYTGDLQPLPAARNPSSRPRLPGGEVPVGRSARGGHRCARS